MKNRNNIFNIAFSCSFWDKIADIYTERFKDNNFKLASVLFLVPNRRACQSLIDAFIRKQGLKPTILPQIVPITEIDDEELFFNNFDLEKDSENEAIPIGKEERLFIFTKLIMSKPSDFGIKQISLAQAFNLAMELANLIDIVNNYDLSFSNLQNLVPEKYATHWQETLELLKIITEFWPQILKDRNAIDSSDYKRQLLFRQADIWKKQNSDKIIVAAGITASFPAIVYMLKTIINLKNGELYFAGIDYFADNNYWDNISESHPQFELKELLRLLDLKRSEITNLYDIKTPDREKFISEIMRPACVSYEWRNLDNKIDLPSAINGLELLETKTQRDEAIAIALKMREILNIPEKTIALVTYDRNLARRVASELSRFDIKIDDSAGIPLSLTSIGVFLRLIAEASYNIESNTYIASLLKNPYSLFGEDASDFRKKAYSYEVSIRKTYKSDNNDNEILDFISNVKNILKPFSDILHSEEIDFNETFIKHIELAETIASSSNNEGKYLLWKGDIGKSATSFITKILESSKVLGKINGKDYISFLCELMSTQSVRSSFGTHSRLKILGPIEARLNHFDYIILGEMNEGIWPKSDKADMWMSRPMKIDFGLPLPEKNIGILASDLCSFLGCKNVIITRAERIDGTPMKKSRWLLRIETVLNALSLDIKDITNSNLSSFASFIDRSDCIVPIKPPAPCPPLNIRPRKLSASAVDLLISDPYSVFAKYILKLYPLKDLDVTIDQRDYGNVIHAIIEEFNNLYPAQLPDDAYNKLIDLGKKHFAKNNIEREIETFWFPKFEKTISWMLKQENTYRENVKKIYNETSGEVCYDTPNGNFIFTAKADRIDYLKNGFINIIDYKTGTIPTKKQVDNGFALQLTLEGLIAKKGKFEGFSNNKVSKLIYWQLGKKHLEIDTNESDILDKTEQYLLKLISMFDFETTPYLSRPNPKYIPKNKDYEHLARVKEWSVLENEETGNE